MASADAEKHRDDPVAKNGDVRDTIAVEIAERKILWLKRHANGRCQTEIPGAVAKQDRNLVSGFNGGDIGVPIPIEVRRQEPADPRNPGDHPRGLQRACSVAEQEGEPSLRFCNNYVEAPVAIEVAQGRTTVFTPRKEVLPVSQDAVA